MNLLKTEHVNLTFVFDNKKKILVTFAIFGKFADFSRAFFAFRLCKSELLRILLVLLFLW